MTLADLAFYLFTGFNALRVFSYLPQILRVARDANGASAISYTTWGLWTAANASTCLYAEANLGDRLLGAISLLNAACCLAVIGLTAVKRRRFLARRQPEGLAARG
jgi:hypothetical protein